MAMDKVRFITAEIFYSITMNSVIISNSTLQNYACIFYFTSEEEVEEAFSDLKVSNLTLIDSVFNENSKMFRGFYLSNLITYNFYMADVNMYRESQLFHITKV